MDTRLRTTGRAAVAAGLLTIAGVEGEWLLDPQQDDGTVTSRPAFAVLLVLSTGGFALLTTAIGGLRAMWGGGTRPARAGSAASLVGAALLTLFAVISLASGLAQGSVLEAGFLLFALGMLLLAFGPVAWGLSLRRAADPAPAGVRPMLLLSGAGAFALLAIPVDPWHDVSLVVMLVAWSLVGACLLRAGGDRADRGASAGRSSHRVG